MDKQCKQWQTIFLGSKITADDDCSREIKRCLLLGRKGRINLDSLLKSRDIICWIKIHLVKAMLWMWKLDHKEVWEPKNRSFPTVVLEKSLERPLNSKEITGVNTKRNQPWIFIGRTDAETEISILWPLDSKSLVIGKDPDARKDWEQEKNGVTGWNGCITSLTQ